MLQIEAENQLLYILLKMGRNKELWMVFKVRKVTARYKKNEKDPHHMALITDRKEQLQVIDFDPEMVFGLLTNKRVLIPNIYFLFSKEFLTTTLNDIEHILKWLHSGHQTIYSSCAVIG